MRTSNTETGKQIPGYQKYIRWFPVAILIIVLVIVGVKSWRIYQNGMAVYQDVIRLRELVQAPVDEMDFAAIKTSMMDLQGNLNASIQETKPLLWLAPQLAWVPVYGGDLANGPDLIELAKHLVDASVLSFQAGEPILNEINSMESTLDPVGLTMLLIDAQPQLQRARFEFDQVIQTRDSIQIESLSPRLQRLVVNELDPLLNIMDDGLSLSLALPVVLGADGKGPKSYLLLAQNEDELRPTGGFITTVGRLVVQDGKIISLDFEGVDDEEDWTKPFPSAPWQLQEYMNARVLILRDSNWFTNFPTSALWAEYLYTYNHPGSVDGVIAFDQQFLVILLHILGPLDVDGAAYPVTSDNVIEYMRSSKEPPANEPIPVNWYRKDFIGRLADALMQELLDDQNNDWRGLAVTLVQALEESHLLFQVDDPIVTSLLASNDWDGAVRAIDGDFIMSADSNIGFNKTNALVKVSQSYDVDLTDLLAPRGTLTVTHQNNSSDDVQCIHFDETVTDDFSYSMNRCYWNYLRVYKQSGVELLDASPHEIPAEWILLKRRVPARVDELDEEIDRVQGYGTLIVVPGGESLSTFFKFSLPSSVISLEDGSSQFVYRLKVQKQPGTLAEPLVIRVHLPNRSKVDSVNMDALIQDNDILIETDLRTDVYLELVFHVQ